MRRRLRRVDWDRVHRWVVPGMFGVAYAFLAISGRLPEAESMEEGWVIVGTYLLLGALWGFTVFTYGETRWRNALHAARFTGTAPPTGIVVTYEDGERFEGLPMHYIGIRHGREVWEVMLPRRGDFEMSGTMSPYRTEIVMHPPEAEG